MKHDVKLHKPSIVAHRGGFHDGATRNTLSAFKKAIDKCTPEIECDVLVTKDKRLVVFHNLTLDEHSSAKGLISEKTFFHPV